MRTGHLHKLIILFSLLILVSIGCTGTSEDSSSSDGKSPTNGTKTQALIAAESLSAASLQINDALSAVVKSSVFFKSTLEADQTEQIELPDLPCIEAQINGESDWLSVTLGDACEIENTTFLGSLSLRIGQGLSSTTNITSESQTTTGVNANSDGLTVTNETSSETQVATNSDASSDTSVWAQLTADGVLLNQSSRLSGEINLKETADTTVQWVVEATASLESGASVRFDGLKSNLESRVEAMISLSGKASVFATDRVDELKSSVELKNITRHATEQFPREGTMQISSFVAGLGQIEGKVRFMAKASANVAQSIKVQVISIGGDASADVSGCFVGSLTTDSQVNDLKPSNCDGF